MMTPTTATAATNNKMEEIVSTITAMCHQEASGYVTADYLGQSSMSAVSATLPLHEQQQMMMNMVDVDCRNKMVEWCYQVVDFCKFNRETVEIAMSYLDRFMLTPQGMAMAACDRNAFQLASMTCLYTAVKIHEPEAMDPKLVSTLSRGTYTPQQVEAMEATILQALKWRVNPPTSLSFVRHFLELIPAGTFTQQLHDAVYDLTKYQSELAVSDYRFIAVRPSVVAFCALMNSLESVGLLDDKVLGYIGYMLAQSIGMDCCNDEMIVQVQNCMYQAVVQHQQPACFAMQTTAATDPNAMCSKPASRRGSVEVSPRSISEAHDDIMC